ncbi:hypothetical protein GCM10027615_25270 [Plantactinospora veratri]
MSTQQTSQENPLAGFGPNEWIVEEMYQRYLADPASVDPAWHDFFADYRPAAGQSGPDGGGAGDAKVTGAKGGSGTAVEQPPATARTSARTEAAPATPASSPAPAKRATPAPDGKAAAAPKPAASAPKPAASAPKAAAPSSAGKGSTPSTAGKGAATKPSGAQTTRCAAWPPGSCRTWTPRSRCRPRPASARSRPSCWSTTAS